MKTVELGRPLGAVLVLGLGVVLGGLGLVTGWADLTAAEAEREAKADFVSRALRVDKRVVAGSLPSVATAPLHVLSESETLAAAHVDALVRAMTGEAGGTVLSSRAEAKHDEPGLGGRIEVQAVIEAENDALQALLLHFEGGAPMILVDELTIQPVESTSGDGSEPVSPRLHAAMTLSAYWQPPLK